MYAREMLTGSSKSPYGSSPESYWHLFDVFWAAEAALIQCFNEDCIKPVDISAGWTTREDKIYNATRLRNALFDGVYVNVPHHHDNGPARISLAASLAASKFIDPSLTEDVSSMDVI